MAYLKRTDFLTSGTGLRRKSRRDGRAFRVNSLECLEERLVLSGLKPISGSIAPVPSALVLVTKTAPQVSFDDAYSTPVGVNLLVASPGVLTNDQGPLSGPTAMTAALVTNPAHGMVLLSRDGSFLYKAALGYAGTDAFTYRAVVSGVASQSSTVTINIKGPGIAPKLTPVLANDSYTTTSGRTVAVEGPGVLGNDFIPASIHFRVVAASSPSHGTLNLKADGSFDYIPASGFVGTDSFFYRVVDPSGVSSVPASVAITVGPMTRADLEASAKAEAAAYITTQAGTAPMAPGGPMGMDDDAGAVSNLVGFQSVTATAILSGNWSDPNTWLGQKVPGPRDNVWVMPGRTVTVASTSSDPVHTLRVTGTLRFAPDRNTQLEADTVVVDPSGTLTIGTSDQPIGASFSARMVFTGSSPIDMNWDPGQYSRGLISLGTAHIHGTDVTSWLPLAQAPMAGNVTLNLASVPTGWKAGDTLTLAGTHYTGTDQTQDERLTIASINGATVHLTSALQYNHDVPTDASLAWQFGQAPPGAPPTVDVANLTRNVQFASANPNVLGGRGHVMFMHSDNVEIVNAGFYGLGRTDKSAPVSDDNPRGRYALHFHQDGMSGMPIAVKGVAVEGSPGWGIVNHSSNVDVTDSVVYGAVGSAFVSEAGDEMGSFRNDFAIKSVGSSTNQPDPYRDRAGINDYGYGGHGFWLESPTVTMVGNVVAGAASYGIIYYPLGFDGAPSNLPVVAIAESSNNTIYASRRGLRIYNSNPSTKANEVDGLTVWGVRYEAFGVDYSTNVDLVGSRFIGLPGGVSGAAVYLDSGIDFSFHDSYIVGYSAGLDAGYGGHNEITGGYLNNAIDLHLLKNSNVFNTAAGVREVVIDHVQFAGGGIVMQGESTTFDDAHPFTSLFAPERITWNGRQLYYNEQAAGQILRVPFLAIDGKTNAQVQSAFGLSYAGAITPFDATQVPGLTGGLIGSIQALDLDVLFYITTYAKPNGKSDVVFFDQVYLVATVDDSVVQSGWNMIRLTDKNGAARIGFVPVG